MIRQMRQMPLRQFESRPSSSTVRRAAWTIVRAARRAACVVLLGAAMIHGAGCETIADDVSEFAGSFAAPSPSEAGRWMTDLYDDDQRRRGTLLIANSPFGNAPAHLAWYRDRVIEEDDPLVLAALVSALGRHGAPDDALLIAPKLTHASEHVKWQAAKALQRLHNPAVVSDLLKVVRDESENVDVRVAAADALGQYPQDRVFHALLRCLDDRELSVNMAAKSSLRTLTGRDLGYEARSWLNWYRPLVDAHDDAFADRQDYFYPTYGRELSWLEKLAFWNPRTFEQPAPPAGLQSSSMRRTYDATDGEGGFGAASDSSGNP